MLGILGSARGLAIFHCWRGGRGPLSPSVSRLASVRSHVPHGTFQRFRKNIESRILVSVQHHATPCTQVCTDTHLTWRVHRGQGMAYFHGSRPYLILYPRNA